MAASLVLLLSALSAVNGATLSKRACDTYTVAGIRGGFTERTLLDFSTVPAGADIAEWLYTEGNMYISDYPIEDGPVPRHFRKENVALVDGKLDMKVNGYSGSGYIWSSEISTLNSFKYASVRTVLKSSKTPGICEGNFLYGSKNQEVDWELLTTTSLKASEWVPAGIWATNQELTEGAGKTFEVVPFTFDPTAAFHEYRIDWTAEATTFFIDGVQKARLTTNVPTQAGPWLWNSWSNGDKYWSAGPPKADAHTQIAKIDIFYGYQSTTTGSVCAAP